MSEQVGDRIERKIAEAIRDNADSLMLYGSEVTDSLPRTLLDISTLRHLSLSNVNIEIPEWIAEFSLLESLHLQESGSVGALVPHLGKMKNLHTLTLSYVDDLTEFPPSLSQLTLLKELNVDGAKFDVFPPVVSLLSSLESFSYAYCECSLEEVFDMLSKLPHLRHIRLTHDNDGNGDVLPESFCRLPAIEELCFNHWLELMELPECIGNLRNLRILDLSNDDSQIGFTAGIHELPESLCTLPYLESLDLFGLQDLKKLPTGFSRLSRLKRLDIVDSGIEELCLTPEQWRNLEEVRMQGPLPDFRQCVNLKSFSWYRNMVSVRRGGTIHGTDGAISLDGIESLSRLESLWICGGALDSTAFLTSMPRLRRLHLSCDFETLPDGFENLQHLEELCLWGAVSLESLPEGVGDMPSLKNLYLTGCGVRTLPESVRKRKDLQVHVSYCPCGEEYPGQ